MPHPLPPQHALLCHPDRPCAAAGAVDAGAQFAADGTLALSYRWRGDLAGLRLPAAQLAGPADDLWRHTCCEAFIAAVDAPDYREFNFSPSGQWAAYRFTDYRQRDPGFVASEPPRLAFRLDADGFRLDAWLPPALLPASGTLQIGLTTVIEAAEGGQSYWALAHAAGPADFHQRANFLLTLKVPTP